MSIFAFGDQSTEQEDAKFAGRLREKTLRDRIVAFGDLRDVHAEAGGEKLRQKHERILNQRFRRKQRPHFGKVRLFVFTLNVELNAVDYHFPFVTLLTLN